MITHEQIQERTETILSMHENGFTFKEIRSHLNVANKTMMKYYEMLELKDLDKPFIDRTALRCDKCGGHPTDRDRESDTQRGLSTLTRFKKENLCSNCLCPELSDEDVRRFFGMI